MNLGRFSTVLYLCPLLVTVLQILLAVTFLKTTKVKRKLFLKVEKTLTVRQHLMTLPNDRGLLCLIHSREGDKQQEMEREEEEES